MCVVAALLLQLYSTGYTDQQENRVTGSTIGKLAFLEIQEIRQPIH